MCQGEQTGRQGEQRKLRSEPDSFLSLVFFSLKMNFGFLPSFLFLELATTHTHLGARGELNEALWQRFAVILQMSSQSSGKGKWLNFLQES